MKKIFLMIILVLFNTSLLSNDFNANDVMKIINNGLKKCNNCPKTDPLYDNSVNMYKLLKKVKYAGIPKVIVFMDKPVIYISPLFDENKKFIDAMFFDITTHSQQNWPSVSLNGVRKEKVTLNKWNNNTKNDFYEKTFIPGYFEYPEKNINAKPFLFEVTMRKWNYSIAYSGIDLTDKIKKKAWMISGFDKYYKNMSYNVSQLKKISKKYHISLEVPLAMPSSLYKCVYNAAAMVADWWNLNEGKGNIRSYLNIFTNNYEFGLNPRIIESLYFKNSKKYPNKFQFIDRFLMKDDITHESLPKGIKGLCEILCNEQRKAVADHLIKKIIYRFSKKDFGTELPYIKIVEKGVNNEDKIIDALHKYGPLLAGKIERYLGVPLNIPVHGIVLCGYIKTYIGTLFIYKETLGNYTGISNKESQIAFRLFPPELLFKIYAFPHSLKPVITKVRKKIVIEFKNWRNITKKLNELIIKDKFNNNIGFNAKDNKYIVENIKNSMFPIKLKWKCDFYNIPDQKNEMVIDNIINNGI